MPTAWKSFAVWFCSQNPIHTHTHTHTHTQIRMVLIRPWPPARQADEQRVVTAAGWFTDAAEKHGNSVTGESSLCWWWDCGGVFVYLQPGINRSPPSWGHIGYNYHLQRGTLQGNGGKTECTALLIGKKGWERVWVIAGFGCWRRERLCWWLSEK